MKSNLEVSSSQFIDKLRKVFPDNTKEFVSNDVSEYKWSSYTLNLLEGWNLKVDKPDNHQPENSNETAKTSQDYTQDYILSQYI